MPSARYGQASLTRTGSTLQARRPWLNSVNTLMASADDNVAWGFAFDDFFDRPRGQTRCHGACNSKADRPMFSAADSSSTVIPRMTWRQKTRSRMWAPRVR